MGTRAITDSEPASDIQEIDDPEFFAQWSLARQRLAVIPEGKPEHRETKRRYDELSREYWRRIHRYVDN
jgi:hypothetical protein